MLAEIEYEIARSLVRKAQHGVRTTYKDLGASLGRSTGRGLGKHLGKISEYCKENRLPILSTIVVYKGKRHPAAGSHEGFRLMFGGLDFEKWQEEVFDYDWSKVPEFQSQSLEISGRDLWLSSFWGFTPETWGCLGFTNESFREIFIRRSKDGCIVFIYCTKNGYDPVMQGQVVGALEVSHQRGNIKEFLAGDTFYKKENDPDMKGKWQHALKVTRAWAVIEENYRPVEDIFAKTYTPGRAQIIGSRCYPVDAEDVANVKELLFTEVPVYGQDHGINPDPLPLSDILTPSKAGPVAKSGYYSGESDGPRYLYILKLEGDIEAYLGKKLNQDDEPMIIKVGMSKSPATRRNHLQKSFPAGGFHWKIWKPDPTPAEPPFPDGKTAIKGEDAMKDRLTQLGAESLGGEFFLATEAQAIKAWSAGVHKTPKPKN